MPAKLFALAAYVIGLSGAGIYFAYVVGMGTGYWPRAEAVDGQMSIRINFGLLVLFALQHSGMARQTIKKRLGYLGRSIYVATSGLVLGAVTLLWQPIPREPLWHGPLWIVAISLLAALGMGSLCAGFDHAAFFGLTQAWTRQAEIPGKLCTTGPYRYVRHPLMLGLLIAIWAQPIMPPELLMMNMGMTAYVFLGITLEERDLAREFGADYEAYRRKVPALIPWGRR
jgi:methanethiol S-methyltransferase